MERPEAADRNPEANDPRRGDSRPRCEARWAGAAERYALGQMSEPERDEYEEHFFDCPECADEVKAAAIFLENAEAVVRSDDEAAETDPHERARPDPLPLWVGWKAAFWPVPMGAAAALALLLGGPAVYLASFKVPQLEQALADAEALQPAPSYFLSVSRSARPVVTVQEHERSVVLQLSKSTDQSFQFYRCQVLDASGRAVLSSVIPAASRQDELQLLLPTEKLQPGAYVLAVTGLESASAQSAASSAQYHFTLQRGVRTE